MNNAHLLGQGDLESLEHSLEYLKFPNHVPCPRL
jgi:hypothetical protein